MPKQFALLVVCLAMVGMIFLGTTWGVRGTAHVLRMTSAQEPLLCVAMGALFFSAASAIGTLWRVINSH